MLTVSFVHIGTTGNCKEVKEKLLDFVMYINQLVPLCTEAAVVLNVWTVFVPNIDLHL